MHTSPQDTKKLRLLSTVPEFKLMLTMVPPDYEIPELDLSELTFVELLRELEDEDDKHSKPENSRTCIFRARWQEKDCVVKVVSRSVPHKLICIPEIFSIIPLRRRMHIQRFVKLILLQTKLARTVGLKHVDSVSEVTSRTSMG